MSLALISTSGAFTTNIVEGDKAETIAPIVSGTAATATGTSIDFTGIPNWVKRITVILSKLSANGTSNFIVQIGGAAIETTGYESASSTGANATFTTGFGLSANQTAAGSYSGHMLLTRISGSEWVSSSVVLAPTLNGTYASGNKTITGSLQRVRITTVNGTDTFDAGTINIMWE